MAGIKPASSPWKGDTQSLGHTGVRVRFVIRGGRRFDSPHREEKGRRGSNSPDEVQSLAWHTTRAPALSCASATPERHRRDSNPRSTR